MDSPPRTAWTQRAACVQRTHSPLTGLTLFATMRIVVETLSGRSTSVEVTAASTVRGVKLRVQAALGIPHGTQMLSLDGHVLDNDDLTLADYHVGPNAQLRVAILHTSSKERDRIKELPLLQVGGTAHHRRSQRPRLPMCLRARHYASL